MGCSLGSSTDATPPTAALQIQDDYLDCYGKPEVIGKIGTDIEDSKCSWLVCTALQVVNDSQKQIITEYYGKPDEASVAKIKVVTSNYTAPDIATTGIVYAIYDKSLSTLATTTFHLIALLEALSMMRCQGALSRFFFSLHCQLRDRGLRTGKRQHCRS